MNDFEGRLLAGVCEYIGSMPDGRYRAELIDIAEDEDTGEDVAVVMLFEWRRRLRLFRGRWVELGAVTVVLPELEEDL